MTSAQIRQAFLDFFREKQHTIVPSSSPHAGLAEPAVHERRHEPVRADLPRRSSECRPMRIRRARPTRRSASAPAASTTTSKTSAWTPITTRFSRCSATGASAITSRRRRSNGRGSWSSERWKFPPSRLYATVYQPGPNDPSEFDQEAYDHWAAHFPRRGPRSRRPHRQRQQEGQFLDDGRHRPVRSVHRNPRRPHARGRHARRAGQQGRPRGASRSGTWSSSSSTPIPTAASLRCPRGTSIPAWASSA